MIAAACPLPDTITQLISVFAIYIAGAIKKPGVCCKQEAKPYTTVSTIFPALMILAIALARPMIIAAVSIFLQPSTKTLDIPEGVSPAINPTTIPSPTNTAASSGISQPNLTEPTTIPAKAATRAMMIRVFLTSMVPKESISRDFCSFWLSRSYIGLNSGFLRIFKAYLTR